MTSGQIWLVDELQKTAVDCRPGKVYGRSKLKNVKDPKSLVLVLYRVRIQYLYIQISWSLYARLFRQWFTRRFTYTWTHFLISLGSTSHSDAHVRIFYASCVKLSKRDKKIWFLIWHTSCILRTLRRWQ